MTTPTEEQLERLRSELQDWLYRMHPTKMKAEIDLEVDHRINRLREKMEVVSLNPYRVALGIPPVDAW